MKLGYPCINLTLKKTTNHTFRLASYSEEKLIEAVQKNIDDMWAMLEFNVAHNFLLFRIGSGFVPFASHPICKFDWKSHFESEFKKLGTYIKKHNIRICMHPDQFILLNAKDKKITQNSIRELEYHADLLDALGLDRTAKIQIHVGGVYGDKPASIERFIEEYQNLPQKVKSRLVIENDDGRFSLADCLQISKKTGIPIVLDTFHHECLNNGEDLGNAMDKAAKTWKSKDGVPIVDYSSQHPKKRPGSHIEHIDISHFKKIMAKIGEFDLDLMLEIKDKEQSALRAFPHFFK